MSSDEINASLFTVLITVVTGSLVFAVTQYISKFIIEPYAELKRAYGEVIAVLFRYDTVNPSTWDIETEFDKERLFEAKNILWEKGSQLVAISYSVPSYFLIRLISRFNIPSQSDLIEIGFILMGIASYLGNAHLLNDMDKLGKYRRLIVKKLKLDFINLDE